MQDTAERGVYGVTFISIWSIRYITAAIRGVKILNRQLTIRKERLIYPKPLGGLKM